MVRIRLPQAELNDYVGSRTQRLDEERWKCYNGAFARMAGVDKIRVPTESKPKHISPDRFQSLRSTIDSELGCLETGLPKAKEGLPTIGLEYSLDLVTRRLQELSASDNDEHVKFVEERQVRYEQMKRDIEAFTFGRYRGRNGIYIEVPFNIGSYKSANPEEKNRILQDVFDRDPDWINKPELQEWMERNGIRLLDAQCVQEQMQMGKRVPF